MKEEKIILDTDTDAAEFKTFSGWVSKKGRYFGSKEQDARYDGCTHNKCDCGEIKEKFYTRCFSCRNKKEQENYENLEFKEWDYETPLCLYKSDTYFFDEDSVFDYCEENDITLEDLKLVLCKPNYLFHISSDYWIDILPEDCDIPKELEKRLDDLNEFISTLKPISWEESKIRTKVTKRL